MLENLKNIRKNITNDYTLNNYEKQAWAFYQLKQFIKHKADLKGISDQEVNPQDTSHIWAVCSKKDYRFSQNKFVCDKKADYNASLNIVQRTI